MNEASAVIEIRQILCPVDFSDFSRHALDHAVALARWYESHITVLHVFPLGAPPAAFAPGTVVMEPIAMSTIDRDLLMAELDRFVQEERRGGIHTDVRLTEGSVWREILAQAKALSADMLVMGTHGRSGFERLILGSVTEKVLRKAACPVLTVPRRTPDAVPAAPMLFKRILCPVDFSDSSMKALTYALSLAEEADAALTVLHVLELPAFEVPGLPRYNLAEYRRSYEELSRQRMRDAIPEAARAYCRIEEVTATGKPHREILRIAVEQHAELIAIGVRGRAAVDLMVFGSTTQHVLRNSTCPVLTLREG